MENLIGKRFKRNKYGESIWEDTIRDVRYSLEVENIKALPLHKPLKGKVKVHITGNKTFCWYDLDEIVILL